MHVTPLTPTLGAEITGIDLCKLGKKDFAEIRRLWLEYKLLVVRDQTLELDDLIRFSEGFGDLMRLPYIKPHEDYPAVIRVLKEADEVDMGVFGGDWHSDFSFLEAPPKASILFAEQVPPVGGDTLWIDMQKALQTLAPGLREQLDGRVAIHSGKPYGVSHAPADEEQFKGSIEIERNNPEADDETRHPAICRHPETGAELLFVNPTYTTRIEGLSPARSRDLLRDLYQHCMRPEHSCRLKWAPGSLAMWDNRSTLHYAVNDYDGYRRCMYRTTLSGERPLPA